MPYVPGGTSQGNSGRVEVVDVYRSGNVFVNNVPVALWLSPGLTGAFASLTVDSPPTIPAENLEASQALVADYLAEQAANPTGPNKYYNSDAAADGVKGNYAGTVDDGTTAAGILSTSTFTGGIVGYLTEILSQASRGMWRETGQSGGTSNPNITGIWTNLGYSSASPWNTDQTAWCMGFINFVLKNAGYRYVQTASAAAITTNPERWGAVQIPKNEAQPGDIAFWSYRHVNFVYSLQNGKYTFVGGNQSPRASNNPNDGDVTQSYPGGTLPSNPNWVSVFRPVSS